MPKRPVHHRAKLTVPQVRSVKKDLLAGKKSINQIAREKNVSRGAIKGIHEGRSWKDVV